VTHSKGRGQRKKRRDTGQVEALEEEAQEEEAAQEELPV
jgi:hypothetical protein